MNNEYKSDNIMWAEYLESTGSLPELSRHLRHMARVSESLQEWYAKTDWVQETSTPRELGMHRADVLKARIEALNAGSSSNRTVETLAHALDACHGRIGELSSRVEELELENKKLRNQLGQITGEPDESPIR